jgi:uncharacterized membrane protein
MRDENKCGKCDGDGFCFCHAGKILVGIIIFIVALTLVFWLIKAVLGVAFGIALSMFSVSHLILGIIAFVFIVWLIVWIIRLPFHYMHRRDRRDIRILRRRYAKGDINEAQFKKMMKNLKEH